MTAGDNTTSRLRHCPTLSDTVRHGATRSDTSPDTTRWPAYRWLGRCLAATGHQIAALWSISDPLRRPTARLPPANWQRTADSGQWTADSGRRTAGSGQQAAGRGRRVVDSGQRTAATVTFIVTVTATPLLRLCALPH